MRNDISFVYFDVGGVLLIDFSGNNGWNSLLKLWGVDSRNQRQFDEIWNRYRNRICIDPKVIQEITTDLRRIPGFLYRNDFHFVNDFVDRFDINKSIWPLALEIQRNKLGIGLLTDQYPGMLVEIQRRKLIPQINWDSVVDSSVVGMEKTTSDIYLHAQQQTGLSASEILIVDNSPRKLIPAQEIGWQTFLYDPKHPVESTEKLRRYLFK